MFRDEPLKRQQIDSLGLLSFSDRKYKKHERKFSEDKIPRI